MLILRAQTREAQDLKLKKAPAIDLLGRSPSSRSCRYRMRAGNWRLNGDNSLNNLEGDIASPPLAIPEIISQPNGG